MTGEDDLFLPDNGDDDHAQEEDKERDANNNKNKIDKETKNSRTGNCL